MKKITAAAIAVLMIFFTFTACSVSESGSKQNEQKLSIICTIFPEYDWVREILGSTAENAELTLLLDNGVDLHNYQPTADDIIKISNCDMFIYVGGESDEWVEKALSQADNQNMSVINLLDVLGSSAKEEERAEGMEGEEEEEADDNETEYDEHVWLSLKNAEIFCGKIADELCALDSSNADVYRNNLTEYQSKLEDLDTKYKNTVNNAGTKTLLFADRFPFRYLTDDYGLTYYAAFSGCSAETEASFETVKFLADRTDELNLKTILTIENSQVKIAQTVIDSTQSKNQSILSLNSMQSVTSQEVENGVTYLGIMEDNLSVIETALN